MDRTKDEETTIAVAAVKGDNDIFDLETANNNSTAEPEPSHSNHPLEDTGSTQKQAPPTVLDAATSLTASSLSLPRALFDPITHRRMVDPYINLQGDSYEKSTLEGSLTPAEFEKCFPNCALASILKMQLEYEEYMSLQEQLLPAAPPDQVLDRHDQAETTVAPNNVDFNSPQSLSPSLIQPTETLASFRMKVANNKVKLVTTQHGRVRRFYYPSTERGSPTTSSSPLTVTLPKAFYCPLSHQIMFDPWMGPDGHTYEHKRLRGLLNSDGFSNPISPVTGKELSYLTDCRPNNAIYELIQYEVHHRPVRHADIQQWMNTPSYRKGTRLLTRDEEECCCCEEHEWTFEWLICWSQMLVFVLVLHVLYGIFVLCRHVVNGCVAAAVHVREQHRRRRNRRRRNAYRW